MAYDTPTFESLLALEPHGPDTYIGVGPAYPWGRVYGGQAVAQALWAAMQTVPETHHVHSLHCYFIRGGDFDEPIRFEVDRVRNGRSFITRSVQARQSGGAIFIMSASFQHDEDGVDLTNAEPPSVSEAADTPRLEPFGPLFDRRMHLDRGPGRSSAWLKMVDDLGSDSRMHACGFAYLSDDLPTDAVVRLHPQSRGWEEDHENFVSATLDHSMFFHRPFRADEWHLHDFHCESLRGSRGLATGRIFTAEGQHVASVTQEVLVRWK